MRALLLLALVGIVSIPSAWGRSDETTVLRVGCKELSAIYDKNGEQKLLAMQTTSASEALRAGICLGSVREYLRANPTCGGGSLQPLQWFDVVQRIADQSDGGRFVTVDQLLRAASCGY